MSGAAFEARHAPEEVQGEHPVMVTIKRGFEAVHHRELFAPLRLAIGLTASEHIW